MKKHFSKLNLCEEQNPLGDLTSMRRIGVKAQKAYNNSLDDTKVLETSKWLFDIENSQEKCTPFMLAVLNEHFEMAELLLTNGLSNLDHKNHDSQDIA